MFEGSVNGVRVPFLLVDTLEMFPTVLPSEKKLLVADMHSLSLYVNLMLTGGELVPNEVWVSSETDGSEREHLIETLEYDIAFSSGPTFDRVEDLARTKVDPLVAAGWRALLFIAFGSVLILSCLGFLVHAYVSFRSRETQFALMRTLGLSPRQLISMVWLEQLLVIAVGMALGTWMGGRLGAIIMPFLGHDDWGAQVVPPFVIHVNWGVLLLTYTAMALVFAVIILVLGVFIRKISLQSLLRIGDL